MWRPGFPQHGSFSATSSVCEEGRRGVGVCHPAIVGKTLSAAYNHRGCWEPQRATMQREPGERHRHPQPNPPAPYICAWPLSKARPPPTLLLIVHRLFSFLSAAERTGFFCGGPSCHTDTRPEAASHQMEALSGLFTALALLMSTGGKREGGGGNT